MRLLLSTVIAVGLMTAAASAQTASQSGPREPSGRGRRHAGKQILSAPVQGANSFTESEARSQIEEAKGYTNVTHLRKGKDGVWRGTATKDGQSGAVSVDYQGNVN